MDDHVRHLQKSLLTEKRQKSMVFATKKRNYIDRPESILVETHFIKKMIKTEEFRQVVFVNSNLDEFLSFFGAKNFVSEWTFSEQCFYTFAFWTFSSY